MTFKDLQRLVESSQLQASGQSQRLWIKLDRTPFWYWDLTRHKEKGKSQKGACCFNHIIGLPKKDGKPKPMFDYEKLIYDSLLITEFYINSVFLSYLNPFYF